MAREHHLRDARQAASPCAIRRFDEAVRGTFAGLSAQASVDYLTQLGVTAVELLPVQAISPRPAPDRARPVQLLGLQHAGVLRTASDLSHHPAPRRIQDVRAGAAHRRHRGDPRRRLQPHRRGQRDGADAVVPRHRQRLLLPPRARQRALLHGLHRLRQRLRPAPSAGPAAGDGLAALLGRARCTSTASASTWPRPWRASRRAFDASLRLPRRHAPGSVAVRGSS